MKQKREYAAKLLFQFRVVVAGCSSKRRFCEERIITVKARHAREAVLAAKKLGRVAQYRYKNNQGNPVYFEFVGILELLRLDIVSQPGEVWYEIQERVLPMERRRSIIPPESKLSAVRNAE